MLFCQIIYNSIFSYKYKDLYNKVIHTLFYITDKNIVYNKVLDVHFRLAVKLKCLSYC